MEQYYSIQIKDKSLILRLNKYTADKSIKEGNPVYNFQIVESLLERFLDKEGV